MVFAELVISLAWVLAPDGQLIARQLEASSAIPSAWVEPVVEQAVIVFHNREDWAMAFFVASTGSGATPADDAQVDDQVDGHGNGHVDGQGVSADLKHSPRIYLFAPYYLAGDGLVDLPSMPVDVAEYYFHALIDARLGLEPSGIDPAWQEWLVGRADLLMADVPGMLRLAAYRAAVTDFGAHILSIVNELERLQRRGRASGRDVCRFVRNPASLFGLWERSFDIGAFAGHYPTPEDVPDFDGSGFLARRDKITFVRDVLGVEWIGDATLDFADFCSGSLTGD